MEKVITKEYLERQFLNFKTQVADEKYIQIGKLKVNGTVVGANDEKEIDIEIPSAVSYRLALQPSPETGYVATYILQSRESDSGEWSNVDGSLKINIPKDYLIKNISSILTVTAADKAAGGKFETDASFAVDDKYVDFTVNTIGNDGTESHMYLNLTSFSIDVDNALSTTSENPVQNKVIKAALDDKVDKVTGKGLSTNDYDATAKNKLDNLVNVKSIGSGLNLDASTGELTASGASITIDNAMSSSSTNPVQNKVITSALDDKVDKVTGKELSTNDYTDADKNKLSGITAGAEPNKINSISLNGVNVAPDASKNVALTVITKAVNDLTNYYLKSETYTKTEINTIVSNVKNGHFKVVTALPTTDIDTTTIYLVPKSSAQTQNVYDEYICLDATTSPATWEKIGDTQIDLSNYVQKSSTAGLLKNNGTVDTNTYLTASGITGKADKVSGATNGNLAGLDANGNLTDSGNKASDFSTVKTRQTPANGGTTLSLVNTGDMYSWNNKMNAKQFCINFGIDDYIGLTKKYFKIFEYTYDPYSAEVLGIFLSPIYIQGVINDTLFSVIIPINIKGRLDGFYLGYKHIYADEWSGLGGSDIITTVEELDSRRFKIRVYFYTISAYGFFSGYILPSVYDEYFILNPEPSGTIEGTETSKLSQYHPFYGETHVNWGTAHLGNDYHSFEFSNDFIDNNIYYDLYPNKHGAIPTEITINSHTMTVKYDTSVNDCRLVIKGTFNNHY